MVFVRKLMDYIFTRNELKELDDILPENTKRDRQDKKERAEKDAAKCEQVGVVWDCRDFKWEYARVGLLHKLATHAVIIYTQKGKEEIIILMTVLKFPQSSW